MINILNKYSINLSKNYAFTLAEVLITLGVIGVVSAVTMPTLIQNYKKQQTVTQLKKAYSEFSQAFHMAEADYGTMNTWSNEEGELTAGAEDIANNFIFPYIKVIKKCIPTSNECWSDNVSNLNGIKFTGTSQLTNAYERAVSFVTTDGLSVYVWSNGIGNGGHVYFDINGLRGPNMLSKDIFGFELMINNSIKAGFMPAGLTLTPTPTRDDLINGTADHTHAQLIKCKKDGTGTNKLGLWCTGLIMLDGWKISDDYPW